MREGERREDRLGIGHGGASSALHTLGWAGGLGGSAWPSRNSARVSSWHTPPGLRLGVHRAADQGAGRAQAVAAAAAGPSEAAGGCAGGARCPPNSGPPRRSPWAVSTSPATTRASNTTESFIAVGRWRELGRSDEVKWLGKGRGWNNSGR